MQGNVKYSSMYCSRCFKLFSAALSAAFYPFVKTADIYTTTWRRVWSCVLLLLCAHRLCLKGTGSILPSRHPYTSGFLDRGSEAQREQELTLPGPCLIKKWAKLRNLEIGWNASTLPQIPPSILVSDTAKEIISEYLKRGQAAPVTPALLYLLLLLRAATNDYFDSRLITDYVFQ